MFTFGDRLSRKKDNPFLKNDCLGNGASFFSPKAIVLITAAFCLFAFTYNFYKTKQIQTAVEEHAEIISESIWVVNQKSSEQYLLAVAKDYSYEQILVRDTLGEELLYLKAPGINPFEKFLVMVKLIPRIKISSDIFYREKLVGNIEALWLNQAIYVYVYVFLLCLLLLTVVHLYNNIMNAKATLEQTVKKRTKELLESSDKLIESERYYRELFNATGEAIFINDNRTGNILEVNQTMLEMFGYCQEEVLLLTAGDLSQGESPYSQVEAVRYVKKAVSKGPQMFEWLCRNKSGELFWGEVVLKNTKIGGQDRVIVVIRDITERKKAEKDLVESEEKYRLLFENANEGILVIQDSKFKFYNPKIQEITGCSSDELDKKSFVELIHPDDRLKIVDRYTRRIAGENIPSFFSFRIIDKNANEKWLESNSIVITWEGKPATLNFLTDITKRHLAEAKKKELTSQLRQAQKMESIGTLAGGIAHDFNNILTPILGFTELAMLQVEKDTLLSSRLDEIIYASLRAKDLVQQILTFSRQREHDLQPLKIYLLIKETLKLLRSSFPSTITINENIDSKCGSILADPTQIHQIIMNLCTNAYHSMKEKGGTLGISLSQIEVTPEKYSAELNFKQRHYQVFEVSDTGHGIPEEVRGKIFEPYYTTKGNDEGTGLGLSMVHGIVQSLNGHITVCSELGIGSSFQVYLPSMESAPSPSIVSKHMPLPTGTENILLVDDKRVVLQSEKEMLEQLGYHVSCLTSSEDAFYLFQQKPNDFDLVVTDMTMPDMTGDELAKNVLSIRPDVPIVLCTGYSEKINKEKAQALGIRGFISKPVRLMDFAKTIREILDEKIH